MVNFTTLSQRAADIAIALMQGARVADFPIERSRNEILVDWRQFHRFNLDEARMPSAATVWYQPPTIWQQYWRYLVLGGLVLFLLLLLVFTLAVEVRRRKRSEASARKLSGWLINAQEEERRRIARELHDDLSQRLCLLCIQIDTLRAALPRDEGPISQGLTQLYDQVDVLSTDVHQLSHELHSAVLDKLGLLPALRRYCDDFATHRGIVVNVQTLGEEIPLDKEVALALFRVAQECLANVIKHSGATSASLRLTFAGEKMLLEIKDCGQGFEPKELARKPGLGIESMRERLRSVGGILQIDSSVAGGTAVRAEAPARILMTENDDSSVLQDGSPRRAAA